MEYKKILLFSLVLSLFLMPMISADNSGYKIYTDSVEYNGEVTETPDFWIDNYHIDNNGNKVYHIDALRDLYIDENNESNNEKVRLYLPYKIQPDWIQHINHKGEVVGYYFPTNEDWEWEYECDEEIEDCSEYEGNVILRVDKIDEGLGSNTFPIGITGPTWARDGQFAGVFDGVSGFVDLGSDTLFDFPNISVSAWMKFTSAGDNMKFITSGGLNTNKWLMICKTNGKCGISNTSEDSGGAVSTIALNDGVWHHVVGLLEGKEVYVDGVLQSTGQPGFASIAGNAKIGAKASGDSHYDGSIDEVLIYNRSLTQTEITALFNNYTLTSNGPKRTGTPSTEGLVLNINFDDFSVADVSGNGNNGINTNVSFAVVEDINVTLVSGIDYLISGSTLTIINPVYQWRGITLDWDFTSASSCSAINLTSIEEQFGLFATGLLAFLGIIGTILGVVWLVFYVKKLFHKETGINTLTA